MTTCLSTKYANLSAELNALFSCHVCETPTKIPFAYVEAADSYDGILGISANSVANKCHFTTADSLEISGAFAFPSNCALGVVNKHSADDDASGATQSTPDPAKLKAFCVACKPGYAPQYALTTANVAVVYSCLSQSSGCEVSGGEVNACQKCKANYVWTVNSSNNIDKALCVSFTKDPNCLAVSGSGSTAICKFCKKSYSFNRDNVCEKLTPYNCAVNQFELIPTLGFDQLKTAYNLMPAAVGCHSCLNDNVAIFEQNPNFICVKSGYVENDQQIENSHISKNCLHFGHSDGYPICLQCEDGLVLSNGGKCFAQSGDLSNCKLSVNETQCKQCLPDFTAVNYKCEAVSIENCASFSTDPTVAYQICSGCADYFYLDSQNNTCIQGNIRNCKVYIDEKQCKECDPKY